MCKGARRTQDEQTGTLCGAPPVRKPPPALRPSMRLQPQPSLLSLRSCVVAVILCCSWEGMVYPELSLQPAGRLCWIPPGCGLAAVCATRLEPQDLSLHQLGIKTSFFHELLVWALLHHAALVQHNDVVCLLDSAQPVCYDKHCVVLQVTVNRLLNLLREEKMLVHEHRWHCVGRGGEQLGGSELRNLWTGGLFSGYAGDTKQGPL